MEQRNTQLQYQGIRGFGMGEVDQSIRHRRLGHGGSCVVVHVGTPLGIARLQAEKELEN